MSTRAIVCPHCGHRQRDRDVVDPELAGPKPRPKGLSISSEEAAALFAVKGISRGTYDLGQRRGFAALVLPREEARGARRRLEWLLTGLSLPLLLPGFLLLALRPGLSILRPGVRRHLLEGSELGLSVLAGLSGTLALSTLGSLSGWSPSLTWGLVGIAVGALVGRLALRRAPPA